MIKCPICGADPDKVTSEQVPGTMPIVTGPLTQPRNQWSSGTFSFIETWHTCSVCKESADFTGENGPIVEKALREAIVNAPYQIVIRKLTLDEGDGWLAYMPDFGHSACSATGDTEIEALEFLRKIFPDIVEFYLKERIVVPEPTKVFFYTPQHNSNSIVIMDGRDSESKS